MSYVPKASSCLAFGPLLLVLASTFRTIHSFIVPSRVDLPSRTRCVFPSLLTPMSTTVPTRLAAIHARRRKFDDDDDTYDDEYINELINEKFDDFGDDDILDVDTIESNKSHGVPDGTDDERYEYARMGRRRGQGKVRYGEEEGGISSDDDIIDADQSSYSTGSRRENRGTTRGHDQVYDEDEGDDSYDDDNEFFEEGILIPNPTLDAVDPEGAADRIGELFVDPKWWRDAAAIATVIVAV